MGFDCETANIGLNYLERYLSIEKVDKEKLRVAMYACFSLAACVHENVRVGMSSTTRSVPSVYAVKRMEAYILKLISWRVHPVTSHCIARNVLALLPACKESLSHQRQEDVEMLLCAAAGQYNLVHETPAMLALAAVLAATIYSNLPKQPVWDLMGDVGLRINCDCLNERSDEMIMLLKLYDEPAERVQGICFDEQHAAPLPYPLVPEGASLPVNYCSVPISEKWKQDKKQRLEDGFTNHVR